MKIDDDGFAFAAQRFTDALRLNHDFHPNPRTSSGLADAFTL
jgi:hypothetical protein